MSTRHWKRILGSLWALGLAFVLFAWWNSELSLQDTPLALQELLGRFGLYRAALCYIILYTVRPLIFFPATLLTVASGLLFGPWLGILPGLISFVLLGGTGAAGVENRLFLFGLSIVILLLGLLIAAWLKRLEVKRLS